MKRIYLIITLLSVFSLYNAQSQNLVLNPDFETVNAGNLKCSWYLTSTEFSSAINNWRCPTGGSTDIFNSTLSSSCFCHTTGSGNLIGPQTPRSGNTYVAVVTYGSGGCTPYREYVQGQLSSSLVPGQQYCIELYVSLADNNTYAANNIGIYFTTGTVSSSSMCVYNVTPQLNYTGAPITNSTGWTLLSFTFTPTVAYNYFMIGNFYSDAATTAINVGGSRGTSRYYVEDVSIELCTSAPVITVNNPTICSGGSATITASSSIAGTTYLWNTGAITNPLIVSPAVTTTYTVTGTAPSGQTGTASATVTVNPLPTITASASPSTICAGSSSNISATSSVTGTTYNWNQGLGAGANHTVNPAVTTTYTVTGSALGCTGTDNVIVTVNSLPTITASATPTPICAGSSSSISSTSSVTGTTYNWDQGLGAGTNHTVSPVITTTYTVTGTANGCSGTANVIVTVNPTPVITALAVNDTICLGATSNLSATSSVGSTTYNWNNGLGAGANHAVNPAATTTYTVTGTANGCTGTANALVTVVPSILIDISTIDSVLCFGDSTQLTVIGAPGGSTYLWSTTSTQTSIIVQPTITTTYSVTASSNGCDGTSDILITVNPLPTVSLSNDTICNGDIGSLLASGASTYIWNNSTTVNPLTDNPSVTTIYTVTGTDVNGCSSTGQGEIYIVDPPTLVLSSTDAHCNQSDGSATVIATGGSGIYTYTWNTIPISTTSTVNNVPPGSYSVTVTDNGCASVSSVNVGNILGPTAAFVANPTEADINEGIQFTDMSIGAIDWDWDFDDGATSILQHPIHAYASQGVYDVWLYVEDNYGCIDSTTRRIIINTLFTIYIPNAFSPDGNGVNEIFMPSGVGVDEDNYIMQIYDRWGNRVFETTDIGIGWDGSVDGQEISEMDKMSAVFVYYIKLYEDGTDVSHEYQGTITLLK